MASRLDIHLHTCVFSPDSVITPEQMIEDALAAGLTGLAITEHDTLWPADELARLALLPGAERLTILSGVEISAFEGHFLCFGLESIEGISPGIRLAELVREVRAQKAAIVAAHPFRWDQEFLDIYAEHKYDFAALELASKNMFTEYRLKVEELVSQNPGQCLTGSSDAHQPGQIGCYFTEFDDEITSMKQLVSSLGSGKFRPRHNPALSRWQVSGPIPAVR
ncbi:MAG: PHP-associated domain-containing protein [bacterium]